MVFVVAGAASCMKLSRAAATLRLFCFHTGAHNCLQGCTLAVYEPVCGSDGITYGSSCFACCQNVTIFTPGDCPGQDSTQSLATADEVQLAVAAAEASGAEDAVTAAAIAAGMPAHMKRAAGPPRSISPQAMTRFASQGFRFVGIGKINPKFKASAPERERESGT